MGEPERMDEPESVHEPERVEIRMGAVAPWRGGSLSVKGFSGVEGEEYAKIIVRGDEGSELIRLGLGETGQTSAGAVVRLDEVPPPSRPTSGPAPTGRGVVVVTISAGGTI